MIYVVIPLFNDWDALNRLLERMKEVVEPSLLSRLSFLIVDDCSSQNYQTLSTDIGRSLSILRLYRNVGHQKAIALGLSYLADQPDVYPTIVMDSDGEDKPDDLAQLVRASEAEPGRIVFAQRTKRSEGLLFRVFYVLYKTAFRLLTGKAIAFGNFSLVPPMLLRKLAHVSEIWNNYPGGVIRSRLPYTAVPLERGKRLAGESKMNFVSLILHGLSTVSVLMDTTAVRIALFCITLALVSFAGIGIVFFVRFFTDFGPKTGVPSWGSSLAFGFLMVMMQAFLISLLLVFIVLIYRTQPQFIPATQYQSFVEREEKIY
ncbi:MAG: glycosyltransferase [Cytophagales bacterium]|nr:MAG: glycosyltransferase [Cytophagales bacterium]